LDSEGSIGIYGNGRGTTLQVLAYNTNLDLLRFVVTAISELGYAPVGPYLDKRKGTFTSKYKIVRKKDYWRIGLVVFEQAQSLLMRLPIRHREKVERKKLALSLRIGDEWSSVEPIVKSLRAFVRSERDKFVAQAEELFVLRHPESNHLRIR
jgi:hypothetical protein